VRAVDLLERALVAGGSDPRPAESARQESILQEAFRGKRLVQDERSVARKCRQIILLPLERLNP
jgi:hypothetical protein